MYYYSISFSFVIIWTIKFLAVVCNVVLWSNKANEVRTLALFPNPQISVRVNYKKANRLK